jgi:hypothetical protein
MENAPQPLHRCIPRVLVIGAVGLLVGLAGAVLHIEHDRKPA